MENSKKRKNRAFKSILVLVLVLLLFLVLLLVLVLVLPLVLVRVLVLLPVLLFVLVLVLQHIECSPPTFTVCEHEKICAWSPVDLRIHILYASSCSPRNRRAARDKHEVFLCLTFKLQSFVSPVSPFAEFKPTGGRLRSCMQIFAAALHAAPKVQHTAWFCREGGGTTVCPAAVREMN